MHAPLHAKRWFLTRRCATPARKRGGTCRPDAAAAPTPALARQAGCLTCAARLGALAPTPIHHPRSAGAAPCLATAMCRPPCFVETLQETRAATRIPPPPARARLTRAKQPAWEMRARLPSCLQAASQAAAGIRQRLSHPSCAAPYLSLLLPCRPIRAMAPGEYHRQTGRSLRANAHTPAARTAWANQVQGVAPFIRWSVPSACLRVQCPEFPRRARAAVRHPRSKVKRPGARTTISITAPLAGRLAR